MRSWILAFAFILNIPSAVPIVTESLPVRFSTPHDGAVLSSSAVPVTFGFELSPQVPRNLSTPDGSQLRLCFTVQNKRESYQAFTTCFDDNTEVLLYHLSGLMPGVWVARAYLTYADEPPHWRGGHQRRLGATEHSIWFLVEPETWQRSAGLNDAFEVPDPPSEADIESHRRLRVLAVADAMVASPTARAQVEAASMAHSPDSDGSSSASTKSRHVAVTMANAGHLDLALNLLHSLAAHHVPTLVFTLDEVTQDAVSAFSAKSQGSEQSSSPDSSSNRAMQLAVRVPLGAYGQSTSPSSEVDGSSATGLSRHVDVWSEGFADIAVLKPACVWAVLRLGVHALWLDTDIVVFANPFHELLSLEPRDLWIQAGGSHSLDVPTDDVDALRSELCTGLYFARALPKVLAVMRHAIHAMALHEHDVKFGDQSATNLVLHEKFRSDGVGGSMANVSVGVLSPLRYPTGGVYFEAQGVFEERGVTPLLVHNNYLIGHAAKVARFKAHNLWFVPEDNADDAEPPAAGHGVCARSNALTVLGEPAVACPIDPPQQNGVNGACLVDPACSIDGGEGNVLWVHETSHAQPERRLTVVVSLGDRPWFPTLVLPRLRAYASRVGADLLSLRALPRCFDEGADSNACAKLTKLRATHAALSTVAPSLTTPSAANETPEVNWSLGHYDRVALIDDTMLVRLDAPNIFDLVPDTSLGAAVEDTRVRLPEDSAVLGRLALLREAGPAADELLLTSSDSLEVLVASGRLSLAGCSGHNLRLADKPVDDRRFFNSGLVVLSAKHACLLANLPTVPLDFVVLWDQGLLNARRRLAGAPLHDLGLKLNWVGSFNGTNQDRRPCDAPDAWAVHATTGLPGYGFGRFEFLKWVHGEWFSRGI